MTNSYFYKTYYIFFAVFPYSSKISDLRRFHLYELDSPSQNSKYQILIISVVVDLFLFTSTVIFSISPSVKWSHFEVSVLFLFFFFSSLLHVDFLYALRDVCVEITWEKLNQSQSLVGELSTALLDTIHVKVNHEIVFVTLLHWELIILYTDLNVKLLIHVRSGRSDSLDRE